jgi:hypothetical protein
MHLVLVALKMVTVSASLNMRSKSIARIRKIRRERE